MKNKIEEIKNIPGVYEIINLNNNKKYIGSTKNLYSRYKQHLEGLLKNEHDNPHLQGSFNKYGIDTFIFKIIVFCEKFETRRIEQYLINKNNFDLLYNISKNTTSFWEGCHHSEESKNKIREARLNFHFLRGKTYEEYYGKEKALLLKTKINHPGILNGMYGRKHSKKSKNKMSTSSIGNGKNIPKTKEHKIKISLSNKGKSRNGGIDNPMYGTDGASKGKKWINNSLKETYIFLSEITNYLNNGWNIGRLKKIRSN